MLRVKKLHLPSPHLAHSLLKRYKAKVGQSRGLKAPKFKARSRGLKLPKPKLSHADYLEQKGTRVSQLEQQRQVRSLGLKDNPMQPGSQPFPQVDEDL